MQQLLLGNFRKRAHQKLFQKRFAKIDRDFFYQIDRSIAFILCIYYSVLFIVIAVLRALVEMWHLSRFRDAIFRQISIDKLFTVCIRFNDWTPRKQFCVFVDYDSRGSRNHRPVEKFIHRYVRKRSKKKNCWTDSISVFVRIYVFEVVRSVISDPVQFLKKSSRLECCVVGVSIRQSENGGTD